MEALYEGEPCPGDCDPSRLKGLGYCSLPSSEDEVDRRGTLRCGLGLVRPSGWKSMPNAFSLVLTLVFHFGLPSAVPSAGRELKVLGVGVADERLR